MAATKTLAQLRAMARELADQETSAQATAFVDDAELNSRINEGCKRLYNLLIRTRGQPYYSKTTTVSTVDGTATYALPADFYLLTNVVADDGSTFHQLPVWSPADRASLRRWEQSGGGTSVYHLRYRLMAGNLELRPAPKRVYTVELTYVPTFTELTLDGDTFDGINGWEKLAALYAAIDLANKEEADPAPLELERQRLELEVLQLAGSRDAGLPEEVQDVRRDWAGTWERWRRNNWHY